MSCFYIPILMCKFSSGFKNREKVNIFAKLGYELCIVPKSAEKDVATVGSKGI